MERRHYMQWYLAVVLAATIFIPYSKGNIKLGYMGH